LKKGSIGVMRELKEAASIQRLAGEVRLAEACLSRAPASVTPNDRKREIKAFLSPAAHSIFDFSSTTSLQGLLPSGACAPSAICRTRVLILIEQDRQNVGRTRAITIVVPDAS
jgi:hypothetical protein